VGGGLAGIRAAALAEEHNIDYLLVESEEVLGGALRYPLQRRGYKMDIPSNVLLDSTVLSLSPRVCKVLSEGGVSELNFKAAIVATGSRDVNWAELYISGTRPAGVFTSTMLWRFMEMGYLPGFRTVVLGHLEPAIFVVEDLLEQGVEVVLVTPHNVEHSLNVETYRGYTVGRILGKRRVEGVVLARSDKYEVPLNISGPFIKADSVVLAVGYRPLITIRMFELATPNAEPVPVRGPQNNGIFFIGGALAPFKSLGGVLASVDLVFREVLSYLEGEGRSEAWIEVRAGPGVDFVLPKKIPTGRPVNILFSLKGKADYLVVEELGEKFRVDKVEDVLRLEGLSENLAHITLRAV